MEKKRRKMRWEKMKKRRRKNGKDEKRKKGNEKCKGKRDRKKLRTFFFFLLFTYEATETFSGATKMDISTGKS